MERFMIACVFVLMSAFCQDTAGHKPAMKPFGGELILEEGNELKIECYSKGAKLWFSFPEDTFMNPRSEHEIRDNGDGNYTFLRRDTLIGDGGWYACATEGTKIDNSFKNLNHSHEDISWIYVYVTPIFNRLVPPFTNLYYSFPKTIIVVAGTSVVVPCRPVHRSTYVELLQNFELVELSETMRFDPKIGFIMNQIAFENGEAIIHCRTGKSYKHDQYTLRFSNATGPKPTMITAGTELVLQEGTELRIECYSETKIRFLFPEVESSSFGSSDYEILTNENGTSTFLRRRAISNHTGWYGCAGEDIDNNIPYYSTNYTRDEISWIYVYVNSSVPIVSGSLVYGAADSDEIIVPCRPTSPGLDLILIVGDCDDTNYSIRFEPKLGFLVQPAPPNNCVFYCTTNKSVQSGAENHMIAYQRIEYPQPIISDTDGQSVSSGSILRISEEDLQLVCEASAIETTLFRLKWTIPNTVSKDRVHYNRISTYVRAKDTQMYLRRKKLITTITNITEGDSGKYTCFSQTFQGEAAASTSVVVIAFSLQVVGMKGETIKCLVDLGNFALARVEWADAEGNTVGDINYRGFKFSETIARRHKHQMLFEITSLSEMDSSVYQLFVDTGNRSVLISVNLKVQAPPRIVKIELTKYSYGPNEKLDASCFVIGFPEPEVTWNFLKQPKFPSPENATRVDYQGTKVDPVAPLIPDPVEIESRIRNISVEMSGVLTCTACNVVNCAERTRRIIFSASPEPYFTSTNVNRSVTVSPETYRNKPLILECFVGGSPRPKVTWFQDGIPIEEGNPQFKLAYDSSELRILSFPFGHGAGKYTCRAENKHGIIEKHMDVVIADKILGSGAFGIVRKAEARSICRGESVTTVAVKLVRGTASLNFITALTRELKILIHLGKHTNVVNLLGACTKDVSWGELLVIVEYCRFGNLHDYLICHRADFVDETHSGIGEVDSNLDNVTDEEMIPSKADCGKSSSTGDGDQETNLTSDNVAKDDDHVLEDDSGEARGLRSKYEGDYMEMNLEPIRTRDLVHWIWQVSRGMEYLGKRKVVHGDLAARNILLADKGIVKICDFGLAKALYEEAQYRNKGQDPMPIRWMAVEAIKDRVFSFQSDAWSFGVVMWEFFTLARTPYPGIRSRDLLYELANGHRMGKPEYATRAIYKTMLECWETEPANRPSFTELEEILGDSLDEDFKTQYFELDSPYEKMDADDLENEKTDYLTMSPSSIIATASPVAHEEIEMFDLTGTGSENPGANA